MAASGNNLYLAATIELIVAINLKCGVRFFVFKKHCCVTSFDVSASVKIEFMVFWIVWWFVDPRFEGSCSFHLQGWYPTATLHCTRSQKTTNSLPFRAVTDVAEKFLGAVVYPLH
jgi:hypothetical protein